MAWYVNHPPHHKTSAARDRVNIKNPAGVAGGRISCIVTAGETEMRFVFDERKAAQAAAYLVKAHGGSVNYFLLMKLLYLADREALLITGLTITGDQMVSMDHGPVLSRLLDAIHYGPPKDKTPWFEHISPPTGYSVSLLIPVPEFDELSAFELGVLKKVNERYGGMDKWDLERLTHELPEWHDPHGSSTPIVPEEILRSEGKSDEWIEHTVQDAEELWFLSKLSKT